MKIVRIEKNEDYTVLSNYPLRDKKLSLKAKGLIVYLLSLPANWDMNPTGLASVLKEGKTSIISVLNELEECGYLSKIQNREKGKFGKNEYVLFEIPNQFTDNRKPLIEKPLIEKPYTEKPLTENLTQINTKERNKEEINKEEKKKNIYKKNFETFWEAYPKKQNKAKTENWFYKNNPNEELMKIILQKLTIFKKSKSWQEKKGQYIPLPTTWLNGKRWEDDISETDIEPTEEELTAEIEKQLKEEGFYENRRN